MYPPFSDSDEVIVHGETEEVIATFDPISEAPHVNGGIPSYN